MHIQNSTFNLDNNRQLYIIKIDMIKVSLVLCQWMLTAINLMIAKNN